MKPSRQTRLVTAIIALVSVLFTQLALAAYACPSLQPVAKAEMHAMGHDAVYAIDASDATGFGMAEGCEGMVDTEQPALCVTHAKDDSRTLHKPTIPDLPPSVTVVLVPMVGDAGVAHRSVSPPAQAEWLMRHPVPPLTVRNCCFRI